MKQTFAGVVRLVTSNGNQISHRVHVEVLAFERGGAAYLRYRIPVDGELQHMLGGDQGRILIGHDLVVEVATRALDDRFVLTTEGRSALHQ